MRLFSFSYFYRLQHLFRVVFLRASVIMVLHDFCSLSASIVSLFTIPPNLYFTIHLQQLVTCLTLCLPFHLLPFVCPLTAEFSRTSFLIVYPRCFGCFIFILGTSVLFVRVLLKDSLLFNSFFNGILNNFLQNQISVALSLLFICLGIHCFIEGLILHFSSTLFSKYFKNTSNQQYMLIEKGPETKTSKIAYFLLQKRQ